MRVIAGIQLVDNWMIWKDLPRIVRALPIIPNNCERIASLLFIVGWVLFQFE